MFSMWWRVTFVRSAICGIVTPRASRTRRSASPVQAAPSGSGTSAGARRGRARAGRRAPGGRRRGAGRAGGAAPVPLVRGEPDGPGPGGAPPASERRRLGDERLRRRRLGRRMPAAAGITGGQRDRTGVRPVAPFAPFGRVRAADTPPACAAPSDAS